jgi:hypothetical protein
MSPSAMQRRGRSANGSRRRRQPVAQAQSSSEDESSDAGSITRCICGEIRTYLTTDVQNAALYTNTSLRFIQIMRDSWCNATSARSGSIAHALVFWNKTFLNNTIAKNVDLKTIVGLSLVTEGKLPAELS